MGATVISNKYIHIDGEPGFEIQYFMKNERVGEKLITYTSQYSFFYEDSLFSLICSAVGLASDKTKIEDRFKTNIPLFKNVANDIVIQSKWK
jgi:hypothetical protein